jgi:hypothetical protein
MKSKIMSSRVGRFSLPLLVAATCASGAEDRKAAHFSGLINDYSPLSTSVKGSPWDARSVVDGP